MVQPSMLARNCYWWVNWIESSRLIARTEKSCTQNVPKHSWISCAIACLLCKKDQKGDLWQNSRASATFPHFAMECFSKETIFWFFCMGVPPWNAKLMPSIFAKLLIGEIHRSLLQKLQLWLTVLQQKYTSEPWGVPMFMAYNGGATAATVDTIQKERPCRWSLVVGRFIWMFDDLPLCRWAVGAPRVLACWVQWISGEAWRMLQDVKKKEGSLSVVEQVGSKLLYLW